LLASRPVTQFRPMPFLRNTYQYPFKQRIFFGWQMIIGRHCLVTRQMRSTRKLNYSPMRVVQLSRWRYKHTVRHVFLDNYRWRIDM